ncbi:hypothetical protein KIN20_026846 [Parelaphostrongylus tenuis]|uniref:Uncharacterized protein n=1 Tax=Parelaphostrongylus tenuis TaxID=148309 RepID=A0AAD5QYL5_PARTN|nr:hypothetical protein KIN20_026846 [Parelaphostrongylus tenuis]
MNILASHTNLSVIALVVTFSAVYGCGVMPPGQARSIPFTLTGFTTLPVPMVYSSAANIRARFPGIAPNEEAAKSFVEQLIMQTVFDVFERQARSALLPDAVISTILGQFSVQINYKPLSCQMSVRPEDMLMMDTPSCIIVGDTVTGICTTMNGNDKMCMKEEAGMVVITPLDGTYLTIRGTVSVCKITFLVRFVF